MIFRDALPLLFVAPITHRPCYSTSIVCRRITKTTIVRNFNKPGDKLDCTNTGVGAMEAPRDAESIRRVLEQAAGAAFHHAQVRMEGMDLQDAQNVRRLLEHAATEAIARAQEFEIPRAAFQGPVDAVEGAFVGLWPILKKILLLWTIGLSILLSSIGIYGLFYFAIQPGKAASEPLFFDYSGIAQHPAPPATCSNETTTLAKDTTSCTALFPQEELQGAPWAAVDFFSKHPQWEAYHYDVIPKPLAETKILKEGRAYFFEVALELPESQVNHRTGMFMVHVNLQSSNGTKLASSIRAARLPHESLWISKVRKSIWLIPMMLGAAHETRTVVIPSFRHFKESSSMPLRYATVSLVMQVKDKREKDDPLEVVRGEIRIGKELTDFQFLLREYFFTCYIIGVMIISTIQTINLVVLRAMWKQQQHRRILRQMQEELEDSSHILDLDDSELEPGASEEWDDLPQPNEASTDPAGAQESMPSATATATGMPSQGLAPPTPELNEENEPSVFEQEIPVDDLDYMYR